MLISRDLHKKNREVSNKTRSPPASFSFKGQANKHRTVKWSIIHFQSEKWERKLFCRQPLRQINQSRALFSFPSYDWLSFSQSWCVLYKRTRAQVPMASSIECLGALLICNEAVVICCKIVLYLQGKNFHASQT